MASSSKASVKARLGSLNGPPGSRSSLANDISTDSIGTLVAAYRDTANDLRPERHNLDASTSIPNSSQEATTHHYCRILVTGVIVPLVRNPRPDTPSSHAGTGPRQVLDVLQRGLTECPKFLEHVFENRESDEAHAASTSPYSNTTFDVWVTPRFLFASASCLAAAQNHSDPQEKASLLQQASDLMTTLVNVLNASIASTGQIDNVRLVLLESIRTVMRALSLTGTTAFASHICIPDLLVPDCSRRLDNNTSVTQSLSAKFLASELPSAFRLSSRKDRTKPSDEIPPTLSTKQSSSCFDYPMHSDDPHVSKADRASALLCSTFELNLRLAAEHPSELLDLAEFAVQPFIDNFDHTWTRQKQKTLDRTPIVPWGLHGLCLAASYVQDLARFHGPKLRKMLQIALDQLSTLLEASEESLAALEGFTLETVEATHHVLRTCNHTLPVEERHLLSNLSRPYFAKYMPALDRLIAFNGACDEVLLATVRCVISALTLGLVPSERVPFNGASHLLLSKVNKVVSLRPREPADSSNSAISYPQTRADQDDLALLRDLLEAPVRDFGAEIKTSKQVKRSLAVNTGTKTSEWKAASHASISETSFASYERLRKRIKTVASDTNRGESSREAADKELDLRQQSFLFCGHALIPTDGERNDFRTFVCKCSRYDLDQTLLRGWQHSEQRAALDTFLKRYSNGSKAPSSPEVMDILVRLVNHTPFDEPLAFGGDVTALALVASGLRSKSRKTRLLANELAFALQSRFIKQLNLLSEKEGTRRLQHIPQIYNSVLETTALVKLHETAIIGLANLSTLPIETCQEMCLLTLVLQISSINPFVMSSAYTEIVKLATEQKCTTFQLLRPHLKVISTTIVERFISTPDIWTGFLNLIKMSQAAFFNATIEFTLPHLITLNSSGPTDIGTAMIGLIAQALGTEVAQLCLDNSASILRSFFMHNAQFRNRDLSRLMKLIKLDANNLKGLVRSRQADILGFLVVQLGNPATSKAAYEGLLFFVDTLASSDVQGKRIVTDASRKHLADLLVAEILSVLAYVNHDIAGDHGRRSNADKSYAIRSIGALVPIIGMPITAVTPQIMATLNSNLQVDGLMLAVLQSWKEFIRTFKFDDIGPIVGQTAAALLSVWDRFNKEQEQVAISILKYLILENATYLKNANSMKDHIDDIPSLDRLRDKIPEICKALRELRERWSKDKLFRNILDRTAHENVSISHESLKELQVFLGDERAYIETLTSGDTFSPLIGQCVRTLMQIIAKGDSQQPDIRDITYRCFGLIGAVDPDRIEHVVEEPLKIVLNNFEDQDEAIDFVLHLIQDLLVPAFRAADDTTHQSCLAYVIQELLKLSGFTSAMLSSNPHARPASIKARQRMDGMNREVLNTITPLLDSKYMAQAGRVTIKQNPIYRHTESYRDWLQSWAVALIMKVKERHEAQRSNLSATSGAQTAAAIFGVFHIAIRDHDIGIARHLLPHLVLHSIISGDNQDREGIIEEVQAILVDQVDPDSGYTEERRLLTAQTLFVVMDHIGVWMRRKRQDLSKSARRPRNLVGGEDALAEVELTMRRISQELMAQASLKCKTYSRALLNFENRVRSMRSEGKSDNDMQPYYENLHRIYAQLDEPDGMEGISTRVISPSLEHQIREHESTGRWTSAQSCWEVKLQQRPNDPNLHLGLLRCLRNLGHYDTMRTHIRGALSSHPEWEALLDSFRVEGACILGDWSEVEKRTSTTQARSAEHSIGRALLAMRGSDDEAFKTALTEARQDMGKSLIAAGKTSYPSIYDAVLNLHMLHEIELIRSDAHGKAKRSTRVSVNNLNRSLTARLHATLPSFRTQEPLLSLRRTALSAIPSHSGPIPEVGEAWISTAKIARRAGHTQTAYSATLQATQQKAPFAFVQRVKLLAQEEQTHAAIQDLNNSLTTMKNTFKDSRLSKEPLIELQQLDSTSQPMFISRVSYAKACLLRARLLDSTFRYSAAEILDKYRDANREQTESEKVWYYLGHFQDSHEGLLPDWIAQRHNVCKSFLRSAALGTKYFYRTLPRVVTIWMDIAADEQIMSGRKGTLSDTALATKLEAFKSINRLIRKSSETIKAFQWFAVFPQLVARIVQKNEDAWTVLLEIVIQVLSAYPQQAMWSMVAGNNSKDPERKRRYGEIVSRINSKGGIQQKDVVRVIVGSQRMAKELLRLCDYDVPKQETVLSMSRLFPGLLEIANTSGLLLPLQSSMTVLLPANHLISDHHRPFPSDLPMIHSFEDSIEIMNSLQKPRKVMIVGSNSTRYPFLVKPKDDLRKDARLMEFDSMINKLLQSQPEARKRKLYVRTYAVLILNEEHGLIEWVPNTIGFRHIINKLYAARDMVMYNHEIKVLMEEARLSPDPKTTEHIFRERILAKYPPVFFEWFLATFPDPTAWLKARSAYARTAAVMSMVGFVLGLGDRHGENILFDSVSGDTVHVDLNCLFDKGQKFEIPERVPFRLTQNMVDAMGVTGYDGAFRKSAEITMTILRNNKESLMSVLEAMVHDPLGEWGAPEDRNRARTSATTRQDPRVVEARRALDPVAHKLDGRIYQLGVRAPTPPYTTNNLVDALIKEATSAVNLAKMYVGWSSWL